MSMGPRQSRGAIIAAMFKLNRTNDGEWLVPSQTKATTIYRVNIQARTCTCPDCVESGFVCKHIHAAIFTCQRETDRNGNLIETKSMTILEKKTYSQNWPVYEKAQHEEKRRFLALLADLCAGVVEPPQESIGRKRIPLADRLFAVVAKVYSTVSARRFNCDLEDAHEQGYLSRPIHPSRLRAFMAEPDMTPHLKAMIVRSSLPLKAIETNFSTDSTGFSASKFVRWYDERYGVTKSGHDWVKVHVAMGVKTGVVTAAAIYGRDANDCPILPELVKKTKENFTIKEVSADKGYLSVENVETIFAAGGIPYIHPKENSTGGVGGLFEKMIHFYRYKQNEFLAHYHKRSNVEALFSSVKRKFSDHVRSRTPEAMANEAYAKLVCNNLCCVIMSQLELGIEAEFWQDEKSKPSGVLPIRLA